MGSLVFVLSAAGWTLLQLVAANAATIVVNTDSSWEVSSDGETWQSATEHSAFGVNPGIWDSTFDQDIETLLFRKNFVIPGTVQSAAAEGGADDDLLNFSINGSTIFGESSGFADTLLVDNSISSVIFRSGINTITALARNTFCCHSSFGAKVTVEYAPIPLPAGLPLLLCSAGFLVMARRRLRVLRSGS